MTDEYWVPFLRGNQRLWALLGVLLWAVLGPLDTRAATLTVTNNNDSGAGSLRQAILDANATNGLDTIVFQIPGAGLHTIALLATLPPISDAVVIDGTTQPGFTNRPIIELNGGGLANVDGFRLTAVNSTIRGLVINRFGGAGIHVQAPGGTNFIQGNFIGTDSTGTLNQGNGQSATRSGGIWIEGSSGNCIGGTDPTNRNLISGNGGSGVYILNCAGNIVQGNLIGTSISGTAALGNSTNGISLYSASGNLLGGTSTGARNVISGNGSSGVILYGSGSTGNLIQGNYIGTDTNGTLAIPNGIDGVTVNGSSANIIGGAAVGAGNLLSGNSQGGVALRGAGTDANLVQGNLIGTDASGRLALGNTFSGVTISLGNSNVIGGTSAAARNIVSANKLSGVLITTNSVGNLVQGNHVGVDVTGTNALGNLADGVTIDSASSNTVGGTTSGARNVISGNTKYGIQIFRAAATANVIQGNYVGPNATGKAALANKWSGVLIFQSSGNTVGGTQSGAGNVISGNITNGIFLISAGTTGNLLQGNFIGTAPGGTSAMGNTRAGIGISDAPGNTIGGTVAGAGNVVSGNGDQGMYLVGASATGNLIQGNKIGTDVSGTAGLGNTSWGIYVERALTNTIGGSVPGAGNLISANLNWGLFLTNNASWNTLQGNLIGTTIDGLTALGNGYGLGGFHEVEVRATCHDNTIGGISPGAGNVIAFAPVFPSVNYAGIRMRDGATNNLISGNSIFANGGLGIDLGVYLANVNISCATNAGGNTAQNYPVLAQAVSGNGTGVRGTLNSKPNSTFVLQFFASPTCDSLGNGEGQVYLGQQSIVTSNDCNTSFVVALPGLVPVGYVITATATDIANNTSEFSRCVTVGPVPALSIQLASNQQIALAWTNTAYTTNTFALKQTDDLSPPIQWTAVTNNPVVTNGQFVVTLSADATNRFYVLRFE
jgi:hypothetical protein